MFKCEICGKEHEELAKRIACETKCLEELEAAAELKKQNEYEARCNESAQAIRDMLKETDKMIQDHMNEFESFGIYDNYPYLRYIFRHSFWWI